MITEYDMRTPQEIRQGFWMEPRSIVPCMVTKDGQLVIFELVYVKELMDHYYPYSRTERAWYFNETRDRQIAEIDWGRVYANPQVLYTHYLLPRE